MSAPGTDAALPALTPDPTRAGDPAGGAVPDRQLASCQVYLARLDAVRPDHLALLDTVEHGRRERYLQEADRHRFTLGAALLRLVVGARTGVAPSAVRVDRSCPNCAEPHGKPQVVGGGVHVSISHSGQLVALAVTEVAPIGVDVEVISGRDVTGLARSVVGPDEPVGTPRDFYTYWCRKEAIVKATGDGLRVPLLGVVTSRADRPARLVSYQGAALDCAVADIPAGDGYAAAVALLAPGELAPVLCDADTILRSTDH